MFMLEQERSKAKNSISKNATKFKREVTMPEIENREYNEDEVCYEIAIIPM